MVPRSRHHPGVRREDSDAVSTLRCQEAVAGLDVTSTEPRLLDHPAETTPRGFLRSVIPFEFLRRAVDLCSRQATQVTSLRSPAFVCRSEPKPVPYPLKIVVAGSSPARSGQFAPVAQLVEHVGTDITSFAPFSVVGPSSRRKCVTQPRCLGAPRTCSSRTGITSFDGLSLGER